MLLKDLIKEGERRLSVAYPQREAREMVFAFLEYHIGTKRHTHILEPLHEVEDASAEEAMSAFGRMAAGEPLQYVTGLADFYGRSFHVTPDVLIPRPETELLCREVLKECRPEAKILDLCTGSGCIAWTLALENAGSKVTAVDISDGALAVASSQDLLQEVSQTEALAPVFIKADVLAGPSVIKGACFDVLVSNPPYVMDKEKALMRSNVLDHEPHLALFVSDDDPLVFYRAIADWAGILLKPDGFGIVEINEALGEETAAVFKSAGFERTEVIKDLSDRDRFVRFQRQQIEN